MKFMRCAAYIITLHERYTWIDSMGGDGAEFGGRIKIRRTNFRMTFSRKNFHFNAQNFWWPFFSHRLYFSVFTSDSPVWNLIYYNIIQHIWPFSWPKTSISQQKVSSWDPFLISSYFASHLMTVYFSKYWGEGCMGRPPPQILGDRPQVPLSLRPWQTEIIPIS